MNTVERLFVSSPDINKMNESLRNQQATQVFCHTIIESFIKSFENSREVVQLLSVAEISEEPKSPKFYKTVFKVDEGFEQVTDSVEIESVEYYDKLLAFPPSSMTMKMRVGFNLNGINYTLDYTPDDTYSVLRIRYNSDHGNEDPAFFAFGALPIAEELNYSLEEASYRFSENKQKLQKV